MFYKIHSAGAGIHFLRTPWSISFAALRQSPGSGEIREAHGFYRAVI
jgi:hypothetical protein